jgi:hypothetical protein
MINQNQIRGVLLEEAVLHLLRKSGYKTIDSPGIDPTLVSGGAGIFVLGRGGNHQIDAIADFLVHQPFSNPNRLLVEAKCYFRRDVRMPELRNAVGVLKDVSEHWVPAPGPVVGRRRYHYQSAMVSASGFSIEAQRYAFAQDIYLIPLGNSAFFRPILQSIRDATKLALFDPSWVLPEGALRKFREKIREGLRTGRLMHQQNEPEFMKWFNLGQFVKTCSALNYALLGVLGGQFPIMLAPSQRFRQGDIPDHIYVRIFWDENGWYLKDQQGSELFSFDLPFELFELYAQEGTLTREGALNLKEEFMSVFQAIQADGNHARIINFELDHDWLEHVRNWRR